jgi:hypothetical protein
MLGSAGPHFVLVRRWRTDLSVWYCPENRQTGLYESSSTTTRLPARNINVT